MSYPLHPVNDNMRKYHATGKYQIDKGLIFSTFSFGTKYVPVEGMKNVEWKIEMNKELGNWISPGTSWGIQMHVKSDIPIKCEVSFEISSEENSVLKQFHGIVTKESPIIGSPVFIEHQLLFAKKQKFFVGQKTSLYVNAAFSYTTEEDQNLYGITKMIQSKDWTKRFRNDGEKDFRLVVGNEFVEINKFFLSLESAVLGAMLQNDYFKENQTGEMKFEGFKFETIKAVVGFCYGEDISDFMESTENAVELLMFAEMYDMENLKTSFAEYYSMKLTRENVAEIYKVSRETNAPKLRGVCFDFIYSIPKSERIIFVRENLDPELHDLFNITVFDL